jgi:hypothetical protein
MHHTTRGKFGSDEFLSCARTRDLASLHKVSAPTCFEFRGVAIVHAYDGADDTAASNLA